MRHSIAWPRRRASSSACVERQRLALGDVELPRDEIDAVDHLGDRVLDLQARVHLEEVEAAVGAEQELARAGADVVDRARGGDRGRAHPRAQLGGDDRRRRLLDHLLVAALDRAVALAEVDDVAVRVAEHLDLDVARPLDRLLEVDGAVAERGGRLAARAVERRRRSSASSATRRMPLPPPPAAALMQDREADLAAPRRAPARRSGSRRRSGRCRRGRPACRPRSPSCAPRSCCPSCASRRRDGPMKVMPGRGAGVGEVLVLRQEAVARVDRVGAGLLARVDDLVDDQVALRGRRRADVRPPRRPSGRAARAGRRRCRPRPSRSRAPDRCA